MPEATQPNWLKLPSWCTVQLITKLSVEGFDASVIPTRGYPTFTIKFRAQKKLTVYTMDEKE